MSTRSEAGVARAAVTTTAQPQGRMERRKAEFRDRITQAALNLFARQGVEETSVAAIIREADIAHKTFFNHFPSKDHLLRHIVGEASARAYAVFRDTFKQHDDPAKRLSFCLVSIAKAVEPLPYNYRHLMNVYLLSGAGARDLRTREQQAFNAVIQQILEDAKAQGRLCKGTTLETLVELVVGVCTTVLLNWSLEPEYPVVERMRKAVAFLNRSLFNAAA